MSARRRRLGVVTRVQPAARAEPDPEEPGDPVATVLRRRPVRTDTVRGQKGVVMRKATGPFHVTLVAILAIWIAPTHLAGEPQPAAPLTQVSETASAKPVVVAQFISRGSRRR